MKRSRVPATMPVAFCMLLAWIVGMALATLPTEAKAPPAKKAPASRKAPTSKKPVSKKSTWTGRTAPAAVTWARVQVDGKSTAYRAAVVKGASYLPLKTIAETMRVRVEWDPATDAVAVNGALLRARPWRYKGTVYLPVGAVSRLANTQVRYLSSSRVLAIGKAGSVAVSPSPLPRTTPPPVPRTSPSPAAGGWHRPFTPVTATDGVFTVTVTDLQELQVIKGYYRPRPGARFVMLNLSQQNVSSDLQIYTGRFMLLDDQGQAYDSIENLSNFWLVILRPGGMNFGYLMFEVPTSNRAARLVLDTRDRSPLTVNLQ